MRVAVAYCRSAVEAQGTPSSARRQAVAITRYATRHRLKLRGTYIDAGVSGATLERPALGQLLADCRAGKVNAVLIRDPDRLSRNSEHLLLLLAKFEAAGVRLHENPLGCRRGASAGQSVGKAAAPRGQKYLNANSLGSFHSGSSSRSLRFSMMSLPWALHRSIRKS
jgi:hypothetical protein